MKWIGISGSWRTTSPELELDLVREVNRLLDNGDGVVTGGALNVDFRATALTLKRFPKGERIKVILPTPLDIYSAHYRKRASEGVITSGQAESLIKQLEQVNKLDSLITMSHTVVNLDTYFDRNTEVVKQSAELLAFQVNNSEGVQDTVEKAKARGIPVIIFRYKVEEVEL